mmetsp:Transcript_41220/g.76671  ORF Transcript_41220/g.76671 Transcript_41220/m.76671 type:complete len:80 (-) Transcript_41220:218-457(-)
MVAMAEVILQKRLCLGHVSTTAPCLRAFTKGLVHQRVVWPPSLRAALPGLVEGLLGFGQPSLSEQVQSVVMEIVNMYQN